MISENLKMARMAAGLSLQELSDRLTLNGHPTTKATLSNYENGKFVPTEDTLKGISIELNKSMAFIKSDAVFDFDIKFFKQLEMVDRTKQNLIAFISFELIRFKHIDSILGIKPEWIHRKPSPYSTNNKSEIENLAYQFRTQYGVGNHAIASVCEILEKMGWYIFSIPYYCKNDKSIAGYDAKSNTPFILYKPDEYQDEMRLSLLKAVGHSLIVGNTQQETEELVTHFARAVLIPETIVRYTFGTKRTAISDVELKTAKRIYGLGKKYLMKRLNELLIIDDVIYQEYMSYISQKYDLVRSSGLTDDSRFYDVPTTYEMRVSRANAEGLTELTHEKRLFKGDPPSLYSDYST